MFRHILKLITNQWRANVWILAELLLSFVCLFCVFFFVYQLATRTWMDKGFDIDHVYKAEWSMHTDGDGKPFTGSDPKDALLELIARLRRYPGVEAVCVTGGASYPYTGNSREGNVYRDTLSVGDLCQGDVSRDAITVFRYRSVDPSVDLRREAEKADCLLSQCLMDELFGPGVAKGYMRKDRKKTDDRLALAVTSNTPRDEYSGDGGLCWWLTDEAKLLKNPHPLSHCIFLRVRPEADRDFADRFWREMKGRLQMGDCMITNLIPMERVRAQDLNWRGIDFYYSFAYVLAGFFLLCAFLGVIGTFWFRTQARTSEIGIRIAMGATPRSVRRLLFAEGLMLFALVWVPGMVLAWLLHDSIDVLHFRVSGPLAFTLIGLLTTLVMAMLITAGVWAPARQASRINPVDALRYE